MKENQERLIYTLSGHTDPVNVCAISPQGSFIVSGAGDIMNVIGKPKDYSVRVWDLITGECLHILSGHKYIVRGCAVSANEAFILSVAEDGLIVWDAQTGQKINQFPISGLACSSCTEENAIAIASFFVVLADIISGDERLTILTDDLLHDCAFSKNGDFIVSAGSDQHLMVWNARTGDQMASLTYKVQVDYNLAIDVKACAISSDNSFIVSGDSEGEIRKWDSENFVERNVLIGHTDEISACNINPDGSLIVSSSWDGTLRIWDASIGKEVLRLQGHSGWINDCAFSSCGKYVVSAGEDKTLIVWDIADLNLSKATSVLGSGIIAQNEDLHTAARYFISGEKFLIQNEYKKAIEAFKSVLIIHDHAMSHLNLQTIFLKLDRPEAAAYHFNIFSTYANPGTSDLDNLIKSIQNNR